VLPSSDRGARTVARKLSAADVDEALDEVARLRQTVTEDGGWLRVTSISQGAHSVPVARRETAAPVHLEYATAAPSAEVEL